MTITVEEVMRWAEERGLVLVRAENLPPPRVGESPIRLDITSALTQAEQLLATSAYAVGIGPQDTRRVPNANGPAEYVLLGDRCLSLHIFEHEPPLRVLYPLDEGMQRVVSAWADLHMTMRR